MRVVQAIAATRNEETFRVKNVKQHTEINTTPTSRLASRVARDHDRSEFFSPLLSPNGQVGSVSMGGTAGQRRAEKVERDQAKNDGASSAAKKAEDDAYWEAAGAGVKSKAQSKRDASDAASDAAAANRAEAKRLAKAEDEEMATMGKPKGKGGGKKKMTKGTFARAASAPAAAASANRHASSFNPPPEFLYRLSIPLTKPPFS